MILAERVPSARFETPTWLTDPGLFVSLYRGASVLSKAEMLDKLSHSVFEADPQISTLAFYQKIVGFLPLRTPDAELEQAIQAYRSPSLEEQKAGKVVAGFWALRTILTVVMPDARLGEDEKEILIEDMLSGVVAGELSLATGAKAHGLSVRVNRFVQKYLDTRRELRENERLTADFPPTQIGWEDPWEGYTLKERNTNLCLAREQALTQREQTVLEARFVKGNTRKKTAAEVNLSAERVRQIEETALQKLGRPRYGLDILDAHATREAQKPRSLRVYQLNPTAKQIQIVLNCLPERSTAGRLPVTISTMNKIVTEGYYFRLKDLLLMDSGHIETVMGWRSVRIREALRYHLKELFSELLTGNAPWAGKKAEEAWHVLTDLEAQNRNMSFRK